MLNFSAAVERGFVIVVIERLAGRWIHIEMDLGISGWALIGLGGEFAKTGRNILRDP
jgi:hypothetical protein